MERKSGLSPDGKLNWLANATTPRNGRDSVGSASSCPPQPAAAGPTARRNWDQARTPAQKRIFQNTCNRPGFGVH
ncbi:hypothetical protein EMGBS3_11290 [Anaerolineaceae bacterium]|nr:hypothetical protein EMGBS3_11290 [Anaerolineaceae bacterium]